jgi:hypothetical protein
MFNLGQSVEIKDRYGVEAIGVITGITYTDPLLYDVEIESGKTKMYVSEEKLRETNG